MSTASLNNVIDPAHSLYVLVINDDPWEQMALSLLFELHDIPVLVTANTDEALQLAASGRVGVVLHDLHCGATKHTGLEAEKLFRALKASAPKTPILLMTSLPTVESARKLLDEGATDYFTKPWDESHLLFYVKNLLGIREVSHKLEAIFA